MILKQRLERAHASIGQQLGAEIGLMLGTGLGNVLSRLTQHGLQIIESIPYEDIAQFPHSQVVSHIGELMLADLKGIRLAIFQGRFHLYEGWSAVDTAMPAYFAKQLGAHSLIVSNAAGALDPNFDVGKLMLIEDHLNMTGHNPLQGWHDETVGPQFPDMARCYDPKLGEIASALADAQNITLQRGIYAGVLGPSLETSAERRWLRSAGGDAVGMSTIMEVIAARQCDMKVLGFSAISNVATGAPDQPSDSIESVVANAELAAQDLGSLLPLLIQKM